MIAGHAAVRLVTVLSCLAAAACARAAGDVPGNWQLDVGPDAASYRNVAVLSLGAAETIADEYATRKVTPRLELRCEPGGDAHIAVRIDWQRFISSFNTVVEFRADDTAALAMTLGVDRSNKITATKNAADDARLIDYLRGHDALAVGVTPYAEGPISIHYDLAEFGDALAKLEAACTD